MLTFRTSAVNSQYYKSWPFLIASTNTKSLYLWANYL